MSYTISVVMATYNGEMYIKEQIQSIINQSALPDELIIIDDGSTDFTVNIIKDILVNTDLKYKLITHIANKGVTETFQEGISLATSDYVMICDQDDVWKREKIEFTKKAMNDDVSLIFCNASIVDMELNLSGKSMFDYIDMPLKLNNRYTTLSSDEMLSLSLKRNYVTGMCMAGKRDLMINAFPIPKSMTYDAWLAIWLANEGNTVIVNEELVYYRQHEKNVVGTNRKKESIRQYYTHRLNDIEHFVQKYSDFKRIDFRNDDIDREVDCAFQFYKDRKILLNVSFFQGIIKIISFWKEKKYIKYTGHARNEALKDFGLLLFRKNR